jgi:hypothetical protein
MKSSTIYSKINCLLDKHNWNYSDQATSYEEKGIYISVCRFCEDCHKKQERQIIDFGRGMIWVSTNKYNKKEIREIKLRTLDI